MSAPTWVNVTGWMLERVRAIKATTWAIPAITPKTNVTSELTVSGLVRPKAAMAELFGITATIPLMILDTWAITTGDRYQGMAGAITGVTGAGVLTVRLRIPMGQLS